MIVVIGAMWAIPIVLLTFGVRWLLEHRRSGMDAAPSGRDSARGLLRERYARGGIDATELEERKRALARNARTSRRANRDA